MSPHSFPAEKHRDRTTGRLMLHRRDVIVSILGLAIVACRSAIPPNPLVTERPTTMNLAMKLESSAFHANQLIPAQYTCDGADVSPPLTWDAPPAGTESLVLICDDPDAPGKTWVHWVLYDLRPDQRHLPAGVATLPTLPNGGVHGITDFRKLGYGGPCPPGGTHRYFFKLYALDTLLHLPPGATKAQVEQAMPGHILASAELIGRYARSR